MKNGINRKNKKKKSIISSAKVLDLFLWHQTPVLSLMIGACSVPLSLLKFDILGCVENGAAFLSDSLWGVS
jgi:hypothetical protein